MDVTAILVLVAACAPAVDLTTAQALIQAESAFNPYAIGVVQGVLARQPRSRAEALATTSALAAQGFDFSIGLGQINARNLPRLGLTVEDAFDPCRNLQAMATVLAACYGRAAMRPAPEQAALRQALSCYYSGNFVTGFKDGYVARVVRALPRPAPR